MEFSITAPMNSLVRVCFIEQNSTLANGDISVTIV